jgi:hypothetical protein
MDSSCSELKFYMHFSSVLKGRTDFVSSGKYLRTVTNQWLPEKRHVSRQVFQDPTGFKDAGTGDCNPGTRFVLEGKVAVKRTHRMAIYYKGRPFTYFRQRCHNLPALTVIASTNCSFQEDVPIRIDAFALWTSLSTVFWNRKMCFFR